MSGHGVTFFRGNDQPDIDQVIVKLRNISYSVRSVSIGLVSAARIAWCPTVNPAMAKDKAPDTKNRPTPIST